MTAVLVFTPATTVRRIKGEWEELEPGRSVTQALAQEADPLPSTDLSGWPDGGMHRACFIGNKKHEPSVEVAAELQAAGLGRYLTREDRADHRAIRREQPKEYTASMAQREIAALTERVEMLERKRGLAK